MGRPKKPEGTRKSDPREAAVDELVGLQAELAPVETKIKRREELRKIVRTWPGADGVSGAESQAYRGAKGVVTLGPCEEERKWKVGAIREIYKALGLQGFLGVCSVTLKAAEAALGDRIAEFVYRERTGSRPITIVQEA